MDSVLTFVPTTVDYPSWSSTFPMMQSAVNELPPNVHLLTLEHWKDGKKLVRLEHQVNPDP